MLLKSMFINRKEEINILNKIYKKEKASHVKWFNKKRKEHYGIIAKKIERKDELRKKDF